MKKNTNSHFVNWSLPELLDRPFRNTLGHLKKGHPVSRRRSHKSADRNSHANSYRLTNEKISAKQSQGLWTFFIGMIVAGVAFFQFNGPIGNSDQKIEQKPSDLQTQEVYSSIGVGQKSPERKPSGWEITPDTQFHSSPVLSESIPAVRPALPTLKDSKKITKHLPDETSSRVLAN